MKIECEVKFLPGQKCEALNYRKRPAVWEPGEVCLVKIGVDRNGDATALYDVLLDRKTGMQSWNRIKLHVRDKGIR